MEFAGQGTPLTLKTLIFKLLGCILCYETHELCKDLQRWLCVCDVLCQTDND